MAWRERGEVGGMGELLYVRGGGGTTPDGVEGEG